MKFIRSSVHKIEIREVKQQLDDGSTRLRKVEPTEPNPPVNLEHISIFYPDGSIDSHFKICFVLAYNTSVVHIWYYPPTEEGEQQRDLDLDYLYGCYCSKIPRDNPSAER